MFPSSLLMSENGPLPRASFLRQSEMRVTVKHMQEKAQRQLAEFTQEVGLQ